MKYLQNKILSNGKRQYISPLCSIVVEEMEDTLLVSSTLGGGGNSDYGSGDPLPEGGPGAKSSNPFGLDTYDISVDEDFEDFGY